MSKRKLALSLSVFMVAGLLAAQASLAGNKKREKHVRQWPTVDLSQYSILYVGEFKITDPKADERKKAVMVKTAPDRIAGYVEATVDPSLFDEITRDPPQKTSKGVVLTMNITQYKPGSAFGRAMMAGAGSAHLDFEVHLLRADNGQQLTAFTDTRTWSWGGIYGATKGIDEMEQNVAQEIAMYIARCKGE